MNDMALAQDEAELLRAALHIVRSAAEAGTLEPALKALVLVLERLSRDGELPPALALLGPEADAFAFTAGCRFLRRAAAS